MATTLEQCQGMIEVCRKRGVTLMLAHKKRFVPAVARLKELTAGPLGPIKYMIHRYPHPGMSNKDWFWREDDGGGPLLENAIHAADTLRFLMGDVERVYAEGDSFFAPQRAPQLNCGVYTIRFKSGAIATVAAGMVSCPGMNFEDFWVATDTATTEVFGRFDCAETLRYVFRNDARNVHEEKFPGSDPFAAEMKHFLECVKTGKTPLTSGEEGQKAVQLCLAVKQSARTGAPVALG
ncbi:MAG: Gfo/Idh/MocA family oxidoreductase [Planctomycetes bacterium]|nr:Gfo/Idh/MocA family oxidoreductase [Planctomycetota bacterium]